MSNEAPNNQDIPEDVKSFDDFLQSLYTSTSDKDKAKDGVLGDADENSSGKEQIQFKNPGEFFGHFLIHEKLGIGGFGVVYRATDTKTGNEVALKLPRSDRSFSNSALRSFQREAKLQTRLSHPSIIRLIEIGKIDNCLYLATEYQGGQDLIKWMENNRSLINERMVLDWAVRLVGAMEHAYENGVVHRDLKPKNIIVVENLPANQSTENDLDRFIPKISDFGLAFSTYDPASGSTLSGTIVGTIGYIPPEQVMSGNNRAGIRGDIYAMGIILAELALGRPLRKNDNLIDYIVSFNRNEETVNIKPLKQVVSHDLYVLLRKCTDIEPGRRYQTPGELREDLEKIRQGIPLGLKWSSSRENLRRIVRRNPVLTISVILSFLFLSVFSISQIWNQQRLTQVNENLQSANSHILKQVDDLQLANESIRKSQEELKRAAYNSAIRLGFIEMRDNRLESVHDILDSTERMDKGISPGLREFSSRYLQLMACSNYRTHMFKDFDLYLHEGDYKNLFALFEKYNAITSKYELGFGKPVFYKNSIAFRHVGVYGRINDGLHIVFQTKSHPKQWFEFKDNQIELLMPQGNYHTILFNQAADQFYYFKHEDPADKTNVKTVEIEKTPIRTNYYFSRSKEVSISADGETLSAVSQLKSGSTKLSWIIYHPESESLLDTGIEVVLNNETDGLNVTTTLSQSGRFAGLIQNQPSVFLVYDTVERKVFTLSWQKHGPETRLRFAEIDETRKLVVLCDSDGNVELWNFQENKLIARFSQLMDGIHNAGFLPDGRIFMVMPYSERIWIWNPFETKGQQIELDHTDEVWSLSFDQDAKRLVSVGDDNKIRLWDLQSNHGKIIGVADSLVTRGRFSDDGSLFAACDFSGFVHVWETGSWTIVKKISVSQNKLRSLAWGTDNHYLICVGNGNEISELNLKNNQVIKYPVKKTCFDVIYSSHSGEYLVGIQDTSQKLMFYQFPGGKLMASLNPSRLPTRMAIDPTSDRVAIGYDEGGFGIVSMKTRQLIRNIGTEQSDGSVIDLVFSPDGRNLITSVRNNRALIYDTTTWEKVGFIDSGQSNIHALIFSADNKKFVTGDMSGKIRVLQLKD